MTIEMDPNLEQRLDRVVAQRGQSRDALVQQAILEYLEDLEDISDAEYRTQHPGKLYSAEEVKRELGLPV